MLDHVVDGLAHTFLDRFWLHNDLWGPHLAALLSEKCRWIGLIRFLVRLIANTSVIWRANILHLAQMFTLECCEPLRTHGVRMTIVARIHQDVVEARQCSKQHAERTFRKRRGSCRFNQIAIKLGRTNVTANIGAKKLNEIGAYPIRRVVPGISFEQEKAKVGLQHFEVGIWRSASIIRFFAPVPFTERKDRETSAVNDHHREPAPRGTSDFFQATECDEATVFASFCTHSFSPFHLSKIVEMVTQQQKFVHMMTIYEEALLRQLHYTDVYYGQESTSCSL